MGVRRHCMCLFSLVLSVKPEVQSVFKEKIVQGDGLIGGRMETGRCRRLLFFFSFQKQACLSVHPGRRKHGWSHLTLSWMLMKLVWGITTQEVNDWQWKTLQDRISPVINGVSTIWTSALSLDFFIRTASWKWCFEQFGQSNWLKDNTILIRKRKEKNMPHFQSVHWVEWFCIQNASIWTWTGSTTTGHGRGQFCHAAPLKPPTGCYWGVGFFSPGLPHIEVWKGQLLVEVLTGPPSPSILSITRQMTHPKPPL